MARFLSLWFRYLSTDWLSLRQAQLAGKPFVFTATERNRKVVTSASAPAMDRGILRGMTLADARVLVPGLEVIDAEEGLEERLLTRLAVWCVRYTPVVAVDGTDGLMLDISGCAHLWGGERPYFKDIVLKIQGLGFHVRGAVADTTGAARAWARYGQVSPILAPGAHQTALLPLPPPALGLEADILMRLRKLGLTSIGLILEQPRATLLPRFKRGLVTKLDIAMGLEEERLEPVTPPPAYEARLPCLEPVVTATGISQALEKLLHILSAQLLSSGMGVRSAVYRGYRTDGETTEQTIGTARATADTVHLFKLFEPKLPAMAPGLGIEVFTLTAVSVEKTTPGQERLFENSGALTSTGMAQLIDRITNKAGGDVVFRYLPSEHHWPERAYKTASSLEETPKGSWDEDRPRPFYLLANPEPVEVMAPVPDYPPKFFHYQGLTREIVAADGPERIAGEWWLEKAETRDYYQVEDREGARYWLFRQGHYGETEDVRWFLHGFFA